MHLFLYKDATSVGGGGQQGHLTGFESRRATSTLRNCPLTNSKEYACTSFHTVIYGNFTFAFQTDPLTKKVVTTLFLYSILIYFFPIFQNRRPGIIIIHVWTLALEYSQPRKINILFSRNT